MPKEPPASFVDAPADEPARFRPSPEHPIRTGDDYVASLRGRGLRVYLLGERVEEPVDHPMIRPSINAVAETYELALADPQLATAYSSLIDGPVNRFLHVTESADDVVQQNKMQRRLGQLTGTCFQRCVGMDTFNSLFSITHEVDRERNTPYHERLLRFLTYVQQRNLVVGGAMTDPKGDRSKGPADQDDPDLFVREHLLKEDQILFLVAEEYLTPEQEAQILARFAAIERAGA